jgi:hypothetical protein
VLQGRAGPQDVLNEAEPDTERDESLLSAAVEIAFADALVSNGVSNRP